MKENQSTEEKRAGENKMRKKNFLSKQKSTKIEIESGKQKKEVSKVNGAQPRRPKRKAKSKNGGFG